MIESIVPAKYIKWAEVQANNKEAYDTAVKNFSKDIVIMSNELFKSRIDNYEWIIEKRDNYNESLFDDLDVQSFLEKDTMKK